MRSLPRCYTRGARRLCLVALLATTMAAGPAACAGCGTTREQFESASDARVEADSEPPPSSFVDDAGDGSACARAKRERDPLGCDYSIFGLGNYTSTQLVPFCTAVVVSNPSVKAARLRLTWKGAPVALAISARLVTGRGRAPEYAPLVDDELLPGASAVITLIQGVIQLPGSVEEVGRCPIPAAVTDTAAAPKLRESGDVFRLTSTEPVFASYFWPYDATFRAGNAGAAALRAAESWSTEYVDVGTYRPGRPEEGPSVSVPSFSAVVATAPAHVKLIGDAGVEVVDLFSETFRLKVQDDLFIGSKITADHPFGLFTGSFSILVPLSVTGGNLIVHAVSPPSAWGDEYAAVKYPDRLGDRADPAEWRFVASEDGTVLSYEPAAPLGAPRALGAGELAVFSASQPFIVRSQDAKHRFHVSQLMTSGRSICTPPFDDAGIEIVPNECRGKPALVTTPPASEFAHRFAFLTNAYYPDTSLVVVRRAENGDFRDVVLDCAGTLTGWKPVGLGDRYEYTRVTLTKDTFEAQPYAGGTCDNGAHTMKSAGLFTVAVWAWTHGDAVPRELQPFNLQTYAFAVFGQREMPDSGVAK